MVVSAGIKRCPKARAAYVTPSHQYPLGATMSAGRRMQLLNWAQSAGSWIIEDDYDSEYRFESAPISSLQGLDRNARVIYIGTFSKVLFPSLRMGYIVIPEDLVDHFTAVRSVMDIFPPYLYQEAITTLCAKDILRATSERCDCFMANEELRWSTASGSSSGRSWRSSAPRRACIWQ